MDKISGFYFPEVLALNSYPAPAWLNLDDGWELKTPGEGQGRAEQKPLVLGPPAGLLTAPALHPAHWVPGACYCALSQSLQTVQRSAQWQIQLSHCLQWLHTSHIGTPL